MTNKRNRETNDAKKSFSIALLLTIQSFRTEVFLTPFLKQLL